MGEQLGLWTKVATPGTDPRVYTTAKFRSMSRDDQVTQLTVIYAYYFRDDTGLVRIFDATGTRSLGNFDLRLGLTYDD